MAARSADVCPTPVACRTVATNASTSARRFEKILVANRGEIAISLVQLYKALGGGWVAAASADPVDPAVRERMRARTDWGRLLDIAQGDGNDTER